jgi:hypothetical protein
MYGPILMADLDNGGSQPSILTPWSSPSEANNRFSVKKFHTFYGT